MADDDYKRPEFLERALGKAGIEPARFKGSQAPATRLRSVPAPRLAQEPAAPVQPSPPAASAVAIAEIEERLKAEFTTRVGAAIDLLKVHAERLAAEARVDALEIAFLLARKIIDTEIATSIEPLVGVVRTAVKRIGESRRIVVRLCPQDAEAIAAASAARGTPALQGIASAQIEVVTDLALSRGDCMVEGDFATVDARLSARLDELRRAVLSSDLVEEPR